MMVLFPVFFLFSTAFAITPPVPPSLDRLRIEKYNAERGKETAELPTSAEREEPVKKREPNAINYFLQETNVPTSAEISSVLKQKGEKTSRKAPASREVPLSNNPKKKKEAGIQKKTPLKELHGICYFPETLRITTLSVPVEIPCEFEDGIGTLRGSLLPDFNSYSLILKPKEVYVEGESYRVSEGYAVTLDGNSPNVADSVNRKVLDRIFAKAISEGSVEGLNAYQEYVRSKYTTTTYVGTENPVTIQNKNYPSNYPVISAFLGVLKGITEGVAEYFREKEKRVPVIYTVNAGKRVKVFLKLEAK